MNYRNLTFESFVRLPSSACAYQLCRAVTRSAPTGPRVVLLHGLTGVGKTHLLGATAWAFRLLHPDRRVVVTTAHELRYALVQAIRVDRVREFEAGYLDVALLVIDDLHTLVDCLGTQDGLARSVAKWAAAGAHVIGAATSSPETLGVFRSVLAETLHVRQCRVARPSRSEIRQIVATLASGRSMAMSFSSLTKIARNSAGDVRRALGALTHIEATARLPGGRLAPAWMARTATGAR